MPTVKIDVRGIEDVRRRYSRVAVHEAFDKAFKRGIDRWVNFLSREAHKGFTSYSGGGGIKRADKIRSRSGTMQKSLSAGTKLAKKIKGGYVGVVGYGGGIVKDFIAIHEGSKDHVITPKRAKVLAIPILEALTPAGVPRYSSPRNIKGGFWRKGQSGERLYFYGPKGVTGGPLFLGLKRAKVKPRRPLMGAHEKHRRRGPVIVRLEVRNAIKKLRAG
jgi:hypothetical protein